MYARGIKGIPAHNEGNIVIRTGLSVLTKCGHVIRLMRDETNKVATISVSKNTPSAVADTSLSAAVKMFEARAHRFLTKEWRVVAWTGDVE